MKRICLMNIWIGKLPDNFFLWKETAARNKMIDFYLITDQDISIDSDNIFVIHHSFEEVRAKIQSLFDFAIELKTPYKMCDYKPVWGHAFPEITEGYEFWGHCDLDIFFGDISHFLTDEVLDRYDKLFESGFFILYRNNEEMNSLYKRSMEKDNFAYPYRKAFKCHYACYFDEFMGMNILGWKYCNDKVLRDQDKEIMVQDFSWQSLEFKSYITEEQFVFQWKDGKLLRYLCNDNGEILDGVAPKEYLLAHVQKRKMSIDITTEEFEEKKAFWIFPNKVTTSRPEGALYNEEQRAQYAETIRQADRQRTIRNIRNFGIWNYIPHYFRSKKIKEAILAEKKFF